MLKWEQRNKVVVVVACKYFPSLRSMAVLVGRASNKGGQGQRHREEIGAGATYFSHGFAASAPGSTKPPCYAG